MCKNTGWDEVVEQNKIGAIANPSEEGIKKALEELKKFRKIYTLTSYFI